MGALSIAAIYFGTFLTIGWLAKHLLAAWMDHRGVDLDELHRQAGPRGERTVFLLGAWRKERDS
jgi:hypothetical protein